MPYFTFVRQILCSKASCLLKKYNLMKNEEVDLDATTAFLDKYVKSNPDNKVAITKTKEICLKSEPSHTCAPHRILFCMKHVLFMDCPKWEDSDNCKKLKDYMDECKPYYIQQ